MDLLVSNLKGFQKYEYEYDVLVIYGIFILMPEMLMGSNSCIRSRRIYNMIPRPRAQDFSSNDSYSLVLSAPPKWGGSFFSCTPSLNLSLGQVIRVRVREWLLWIRAKVKDGGYLVRIRVRVSLRAKAKG